MKTGLKLFAVPILFALCSLFYYFGELIDWAAWDAIRREFFYGVHDFHRLLFLIPIVYASYTARVRGAIIATLISFVIFLPRAFFVSPFPDPLLRMVLFTVAAGVIGYLVARLRNEQEKSHTLEVAVYSEGDRLLQIVDQMADGIMTTGPDYRIRFMNAAMVKRFGDGVGRLCYQHLCQFDAPCRGDCRLVEVIENQTVEGWTCRLGEDITFEVIAAPYVDTDGTVCQISIFRDVTQKVKAGRASVLD